LRDKGHEPASPEANAPSDLQERLVHYEKQVHELQTRIAFLEEDRGLARRKQESPGQLRAMSERVLELKSQLVQMREHNEKLASTLRDAREQILALKDEVGKLTTAPSSFGVFINSNADGTVDISQTGRKLRVNVHPEIAPASLRPGQELVLNDAMNVVEVREFDDQGDVVTLKEILDARRVVVVGRADEERVALVGEPLTRERLRVGDSLLLDARSGYVLSRVPKSEIEELVLEEVPDVSYADVGGLAGQIEAIRDAVELPFLHAELFQEHRLKPPKGVLLYGPPGCGKTLIAKAVANSLAAKVAELTGQKEARSYFLNIKGPELLNKYVGETERQIRLIFQRAKEKSEEGVPVIVFFDEMDALFRTRGSGISSDVENTIVPQLLSEIDGVESLKNVIVIGASNREDMIDPAILRPGRLDVKIKIERPDEEAARDIFSKYLTEDLPLHPRVLAQHEGDRTAAVRTLVDETVELMYAVVDANRFLEVTYANGEKEILYFKDFNSGAMIESVVNRAKKAAIKDFLETGEKGINAEHLAEAIAAEFRENEDLPNTTNPDDWARISGKKGERIVYVRTLITGEARDHGRAIERVQAGQYL